MSTITETALQSQHLCMMDKLDQLLTIIKNIEEKFNNSPYEANESSVPRDKLLLRDLRETSDYVSTLQDRVGQLQDLIDEIEGIVSDTKDKLITIIFPLEDKIKKKQDQKNRE